MLKSEWHVSPRNASLSPAGLNELLVAQKRRMRQDQQEPAAFRLIFFCVAPNMLPKKLMIFNSRKE
jgi:hypothetical protein